MIGRHVERLLSAYADGELAYEEAQAVEAHLASCRSCRAAWGEIRAGKQLADTLEPTEPAPDLWARVQAGLQRDAHSVRGVGSPSGAGEPALKRWSTRFGWGYSPLPAGAMAAVAIVVIVGVVFLSTGTSSISAADVLGTADAALTRLTHPGELLHRRWRVTRVVMKPGARPVRVDTFSEGWLGGPALNRSVSRTFAIDGHLLSVHFSTPEGDTYRPQSYYAPDYPGELRGMHLVLPTQAERRQAMEALSAADRGMLDPYFTTPARPDTESILLWEHRANRALLQDPSQQKPGGGLRILLSLEPAVMPTGEAAHRVKHLTLGAPWMEWHADGTPRFQLARVTTSHYISKASSLTLKFESDVDLEDGTRIIATSQLETIESIQPDAAGDPFQVTLPPGAPIVHLAMKPYLVDLAETLRRSAAQVGTPPVTEQRR